MKFMMILTHAITGLALGFILRYPLIFALGSVLPDIDLLFGSFLPHRTITHSIVFSLFSGIVIYSWKRDWRMSLALGGGVLFHIFMDAFTFMGMQMFWPLDGRLSVDWVYTKNIIPNISLWILYGSAALLWWKFSERWNWKYKTYAAVAFLLLITVFIVWSYQLSGWDIRI